jgi:hypothetical protein
MSLAKIGFSTDGAALSSDLKPRARMRVLVMRETSMKFLGFAAGALAVVAMVLALSTSPVDAKPYNAFKQRSGGVKGYQPPRKPTPKKNS